MAPVMAALTLAMMVVVLPPKTVTEVTITRKIIEQIRPYSMAVAPLSSRQKRFR